MADLTLGGTDLRDRTGIFLDLVSGYFEPADVRGSDTVIPALAGRVERNRVKDTRRVVLSGYVTGSSASDWNANVTALMALCDPTALAVLTVNSPYLGASGSSSLNVRFVNAIGGEPMYGVLYQSWSLEFESIDPDWS